MCYAMRNYNRMNDDPEFQNSLAEIQLKTYEVANKPTGKGKDNLEQASFLLVSKPDDPIVKEMAKLICFDPTMQVLF